MKIIFYGNNQVGMIGLLAVLALGHQVVEIWEDSTHGIPDSLGIPRTQIDYKFKTINNADLLLCVHGRKIIPQNILYKFKMGGINFHPFLNKYPGADPVKKAIIAKEKEISVFAHRMTKNIDDGEILFVVKDKMIQDVDEVKIYNALYPLYVRAIKGALQKIC